MKIELLNNVTLFQGDCRETLRSLPDNSVDAVPCDPPYELNFMGKGWDRSGIANDPTFWREVYRVLKPGGHLAAFSASRTYHRMACAIEDAGFEIRDSLMWIYGTGFPKSQNVAKFIDKELGTEGRKGAVTGKSGAERSCMAGDFTGGEYHEYLPGSPAAQEFDGFGTALKPAFEPIVLARKPLSEPTVAANVLRWRTGALNIDGCRVGFAEGDTTASAKSAGTGAGRETANVDGSAYGNGLGGVVAPPHALGRWPANVVTDGSDEVVGLFPTTASGSWNGRRNTAKTKNTFGAYASHDEKPREGDSGSAARFFYSAKASKADRAGSKHPTVKPIALMQWLAKLITPPGGTVLDPFAGSGTTGAAAVAEGFAAILCERESEYVADIKRRIGEPLTINEPAKESFPWE